MSEKNMGRLAQDMKREIIAIIARLKDPRLAGGLLTVTRLDVTPDLDVAKVYVSVLGNPDGPAPVVEGAEPRRRPCPHRAQPQDAHPQGPPPDLRGGRRGGVCGPYQ